MLYWLLLSCPHIHTSVNLNATANKANFLSWNKSLKTKKKKNSIAFIFWLKDNFKCINQNTELELFSSEIITLHSLSLLKSGTMPASICGSAFWTTQWKPGWLMLTKFCLQLASKYKWLSDWNPDYPTAWNKNTTEERWC